jgi:hypothetical protein
MKRMHIVMRCTLHHREPNAYYGHWLEVFLKESAVGSRANAQGRHWNRRLSTDLSPTPVIGA